MQFAILLLCTTLQPLQLIVHILLLRPCNLPKQGTIRSVRGAPCAVRVNFFPSFLYFSFCVHNNHKGLMGMHTQSKKKKKEAQVNISECTIVT